MANGLHGAHIQGAPKPVQVDKKHAPEHAQTHHHDTMDKHVLVQQHRLLPVTMVSDAPVSKKENTITFFFKKHSLEISGHSK